MGTRVCDTNENPNRCVQCLSNPDCGNAMLIAAVPVIGGLPMTGTAAATPALAICNTATNMCVQCVTNSDCAGATVCSSLTGRCVACERDTDCTMPGTSRCVANACVACTVNEHCAHIAATPRCNIAANPVTCA